MLAGIRSGPPGDGDVRRVAPRRDGERGGRARGGGRGRDGLGRYLTGRVRVVLRDASMRRVGAHAGAERAGGGARRRGHRARDDRAGGCHGPRGGERGGGGRGGESPRGFREGGLWVRAGNLRRVLPKV